jgi:hypothetical protein
MSLGDVPSADLEEIGGLEEDAEVLESQCWPLLLLLAVVGLVLL